MKDTSDTSSRNNDKPPQTIDKKMIDNRVGYDRWAAFYDTYPNPTVAIDELIFPAYWAQVRGQNVLEIGCGTGRHTQKLLAQNNFVTALDLSAGMLAVARAKCASDRVLFVQADIRDTPALPHTPFDAVICALVVEHIADLPAFFECVATNMTSGAKFYLSEIHPDRTAQGTFAHFRDAQTGQDIHLTSTHHKDSDYEHAAGHAGMAVIDQTDVTGNTTLTAINEKWRKHEGRNLIRIRIFEKR